MDWLYTADNPLKVFTAFSGYDSQMMALRNLGIPYECVGWSEIDKYAIMAHDAVFPEDKGKNYGDISKINWEEVPDFDLMTYSSPCFVAGTKVLTEKGYTNIEELRGNDKVLTIDGSWRSGGISPTSEDTIRCPIKGASVRWIVWSPTKEDSPNPKRGSL